MNRDINRDTIRDNNRDNHRDNNRDNNRDNHHDNHRDNHKGDDSRDTKGESILLRSLSSLKLAAMKTTTTDSSHHPLDTHDSYDHDTGRINAAITAAATTNTSTSNTSSISNTSTTINTILNPLKVLAASSNHVTHNTHRGGIDYPTNPAFFVSALEGRVLGGSLTGPIQPAGNHLPPFGLWRIIYTPNQASPCHCDAFVNQVTYPPFVYDE